MDRAKYITTNTKLPQYLPFPAFLLEMNLPPMAKIVYTMLLDRTTLSQKNGWTDEGGCVYVIYPIAKLAKATGKSATTIKQALSDLSDAGLIERRREGFSSPSRIFTKLPPHGQETGSHRGRKPAVIRSENRPLTTECNNRNSNHYLSGRSLMGKPIPDYRFEEGESL